jgi:pimeloyl-ACP methyl ester carboxylesterase
VRHSAERLLHLPPQTLLLGGLSSPNRCTDRSFPGTTNGCDGSVRLAYARTVRNEPVLLVHGFASSFALNWERNGWVDLLRDAGREVIAVDLLGHGDAPKPYDPASYATLEDRVLEALPDDGRAVDAVGFSLGAVTLVRAAGKATDRFSRIVLAGIGEGNMREGDPEPVARAIEGGLDSVTDADGEDSHAGRMARAFAQFAANGTNDPKALAACLRRPGGRLTHEQLAAVRAETLVIIGDKDFAGPADPVVSGIAGAKFTGLRGVDHFGTPQNFGFLDAALVFLDAM